MPGGGIRVSMYISISLFSARVRGMMAVNAVPISRRFLEALRPLSSKTIAQFIEMISAQSQTAKTSFSPRFHRPRLFGSFFFLLGLKRVNMSSTVTHPSGPSSSTEMRAFDLLGTLSIQIDTSVTPSSSQAFWISSANTNAFPLSPTSCRRPSFDPANHSLFLIVINLLAGPSGPGFLCDGRLAA